MRYAFVDGKKSEALPKTKGICPNCNSDLIAKCGRIKVWHWAHKSNLHCDPWWETETEWHRNWKDQLPKEWQEISHVDPDTGEQHIADVKNPFGLVIEFQHSIIKPEERISREKFYKEMIWVVDGTRGELDEGYFNVGLSSEPLQKSPLVYQISWWARSRFLHNWSKSNVKVYFDFGKDVLWRLILYDTDKKIGAVGPISKTSFIEDCLKGIEIRVAEQLDGD